MNKIQLGVTSISAVSVAALSNEIAQGADAFTENAGDQVMNAAIRNESGTQIVLTGTDEAGGNEARCETFNNNGVKYWMSSNAGSAYARGFLRCEVAEAVIKTYSPSYAYDTVNTFTCPSLYIRRGFGCGLMTIAPLDGDHSTPIVKHDTSSTAVNNEFSDGLRTYLANNGFNIANGDVYGVWTNANPRPQPACW